MSRLAELIGNTVDLINLSKKQNNKIVHGFRLVYRNGKLYYVVTDAIFIYAEEIKLIDNDVVADDYCVRFDDDVQDLAFLFAPEFQDKIMNIEIGVKSQLSIIGIEQNAINLEPEKINVLDVFAKYHSAIDNHCEIKMTTIKFGEMVDNAKSFEIDGYGKHKASFFMSDKYLTEITVIDRHGVTMNKINNVICDIKMNDFNSLSNIYYPTDVKMFNLDIERLGLLCNSVNSEFVTLSITNKFEPMFIYCHDSFNENLEHQLPRMLLMPMRD